MSIGEALAAARWQSHLTVSEVSRQTRIREAIIWRIEKDDFSACGGDAYARGHIRAIAQAVGADPDPLIQEYDATVRTDEDIEELVVLHPPAPARTRGRRHRVAWAAALGVAVLAVVGWGAYHVASTAGRTPHDTAAAAANGIVTHHSASAPAGAAPAGSGAPRPSAPPAPTPSPAHTAAPAPPPAQVLPPVSASAFGPGGPGTGDNPQGAAAAIDGHPGTAWRSDWYTTAAFGNLKPGTGLLLNMGRRVTITAAQIMLGGVSGVSGAGIQVRAGNVPELADLHEVASARGAGGTVRLELTARAKYVLIWFTRLPSGAAGTYQASVYDVHLRGHH